MLAVLILIYFKNFISANIASGGVNSVSFDKMDKTKVGFNLLSIDNQETLKQHLMHGFPKEFTRGNDGRGGSFKNDFDTFQSPVSQSTDFNKFNPLSFLNGEIILEIIQ